MCFWHQKNINIFLKARGAGDHPPPSGTPSSSSPPPSPPPPTPPPPEKIGQQTPDCWPREQLHGWTDRNPWLYIKDGKLGCSSCGDAKTLLLSDKGSGMHFSDEWIKGLVSSSCKKILAKKLYKHRDSTSHQRAAEIASQKQKETLPKKWWKLMQVSCRKQKPHSELHMQLQKKDCHLKRWLH